MASQSDIDKAYLRMCVEWARLSTARRRKVGCLIVKSGQIISDGYNGTPKGFDNNCEEEVNGELITKSIVLHAESNAITKLAKSNNSSDGATLYVTCSPCFECSKLIIQAGIKRVVHCHFYRNTSGLVLLDQANIQWGFYDLSSEFSADHFQSILHSSSRSQEGKQQLQQ
jgi:dCMP deaminase